MASVVEICNLALQKVGANPISSLSDDSEEARACNRLYEPILRAELRTHPWNCAITRVSVAPDSDEPAFGYDYQYTLPSDCVRILPDNTITDWKIEGRKILTDTDTEIELVYVKEISDPNDMDPLLVEALASRLAVELAEKVTESATKRQMAWEEYKEWVREARRVNAFESTAQELPEDDWIAARR